MPPIVIAMPIKMWRGRAGDVLKLDGGDVGGGACCCNQDCKSFVLCFPRQGGGLSGGLGGGLSGGLGGGLGGRLSGMEGELREQVC